ncbi:MAG: hypothetical protein GY775_19430 [Candidatus Scalindua sp.]|nr:hypothetical protein [Candidatus Scalindua sp.]
MVIKVDKEGSKALTQIVDLALKAGGLQALQLVNTITAGVQELTEIPEIDEKGE